MKKTKVLFIEARSREQLNISKESIKKLPKKIFLAYAIQYKDSAIKIRKQLMRGGIKVSGFMQVLGCSKINTKDPILLLSTGDFHYLNQISGYKEIYMIKGADIIKIPDEKIQKFNQIKKASLSNFLKSDKIGIIVSSKPGQENLKEAAEIKRELKEKGKDSYLFLSNNINAEQFENFNIEFWINTACPGLFLESSRIINSIDIKSFLRPIYGK